MAETLTWVEVDRDLVWRSTCGRYAIVAHTLPENPPRIQYQARRIDDAMAAAYPKRGDLGYLIEASPWCWNTENWVHSAQAVCERHAYAASQDRQFPEDFPAIALERFGHGYSQALAIVQEEDGRVVARLLHMELETREEGFVPRPFQEIDLTALGLVPREGVQLVTTTDHGPRPCGNCGAKVGRPHDRTCSFAKCLVTGQQRLLCSYFGGSPTAGVEAVISGAQGEFEHYFKTETGHDCGQDIWAG